ncbi:MAG: translation initiation factor [Paludibacter sp.]|nr:translation initiation factor [Paludibacter sp.]
MKKINDWKDNLGIIYSTNPNFSKKTEESEQTPVPAEKIFLRIELDKRNGKVATIVSGFTGTETQLKELSKVLKVKCSTGGSQRDDEILIQGDFRIKIAEIVTNLGYKIKRIGF